jgi:hypothetical protein
VAVGYSGRRIRSTDLGLTWTDDQTLENNGGDDPDLFRAVPFGNDVFVAAGWKIFTSPDGKTWQEHTSNAASQWLAVSGSPQGLESASTRAHPGRADS